MNSILIFVLGIGWLTMLFLSLALYWETKLRFVMMDKSVWIYRRQIKRLILQLESTGKNPDEIYQTLLQYKFNENIVRLELDKIINKRRKEHEKRFKRQTKRIKRKEEPNQTRPYRTQLNPDRRNGKEKTGINNGFGGSKNTQVSPVGNIRRDKGRFT